MLVTASNTGSVSVVEETIVKISALQGHHVAEVATFFDCSASNGVPLLRLRAQSLGLNTQNMSLPETTEGSLALWAAWGVLPSGGVAIFLTCRVNVHPVRDALLTCVAALCSNDVAFITHGVPTRSLADDLSILKEVVPDYLHRHHADDSVYPGEAHLLVVLCDREPDSDDEDELHERLGVDVAILPPFLSSITQAAAVRGRVGLPGEVVPDTDFKNRFGKVCAALCKNAGVVHAAWNITPQEWCGVVGEVASALGAGGCYLYKGQRCLAELHSPDIPKGLEAALEEAHLRRIAEVHTANGTLVGVEGSLANIRVESLRECVERLDALPNCPFTHGVVSRFSEFTAVTNARKLMEVEERLDATAQKRLDVMWAKFVEVAGAPYARRDMLVPLLGTLGEEFCAGSQLREPQKVLSHFLAQKSWSKIADLQATLCPQDTVDEVAAEAARGKEVLAAVMDLTQQSQHLADAFLEDLSSWEAMVEASGHVGVKRVAQMSEKLKQMHTAADAAVEDNMATLREDVQTGAFFEDYRTQRMAACLDDIEGNMKSAEDVIAETLKTCAEVRVLIEQKKNRWWQGALAAVVGVCGAVMSCGSLTFLGAAVMGGGVNGMMTSIYGDGNTESFLKSVFIGGVSGACGVSAASYVSKYIGGALGSGIISKGVTNIVSGAVGGVTTNTVSNTLNLRNPFEGTCDAVLGGVVGGAALTATEMLAATDFVQNVKEAVTKVGESTAQVISDITKGVASSALSALFMGDDAGDAMESAFFSVCISKAVMSAGKRIHTAWKKGKQVDPPRQLRAMEPQKEASAPQLDEAVAAQLDDMWSAVESACVPNTDRTTLTSLLGTLGDEFCTGASTQDPQKVLTHYLAEKSWEQLTHLEASQPSEVHPQIAQQKHLLDTVMSQAHQQVGFAESFLDDLNSWKTMAEAPVQPEAASDVLGNDSGRPPAPVLSDIEKTCAGTRDAVKNDVNRIWQGTLSIVVGVCGGVLLASAAPVTIGTALVGAGVSGLLSAYTGDGNTKQFAVDMAVGGVSGACGGAVMGLAEGGFLGNLACNVGGGSASSVVTNTVSNMLNGEDPFTGTGGALLGGAIGGCTITSTQRLAATGAIQEVKKVLSSATNQMAGQVAANITHDFTNSALTAYCNREPVGEAMRKTLISAAMKGTGKTVQKKAAFRSRAREQRSKRSTRL